MELHEYIGNIHLRKIGSILKRTDNFVRIIGMFIAIFQQGTNSKFVRISVDDSIAQYIRCAKQTFGGTLGNAGHAGLI
mgnify:CR=1 FL=1